MLGRRRSSRQDRSAAVDDVGSIPSSGLTRWLRQGIELHMCPLCRVAHKADREYMWQFSEEGFGNEATMEALARARGFCTEHADMLRRIDVAMKSMLGISTIYVELFAGSPGLCFPHFELVWASGGTSQARQLILDVQSRAVAVILDDLREFIRKEGVESKHEPKSTEQDAWQRAIALTAGWPAPPESASIPETHPLQAG